MQAGAEKSGVVEASYASAIIGVLSPVSSHCLVSYSPFRILHSAFRKGESDLVLFEQARAEARPLGSRVARRIGMMSDVIGEQLVEQIKSLREHADDRKRQFLRSARILPPQPVMRWMM